MTLFQQLYLFGYCTKEQQSRHTPWRRATTPHQPILARLFACSLEAFAAALAAAVATMPPLDDDDGGAVFPIVFALAPLPLRPKFPTAANMAAFEFVLAPLFRPPYPPPAGRPSEAAAAAVAAAVLTPVPPLAVPVPPPTMPLGPLLFGPTVLGREPTLTGAGAGAGGPNGAA